MATPRVLAFAASNSLTSINRRLALHAGDVLHALFDCTIKVSSLDLNDFEMPIYSPERQEANGIPQKARDFYSRIGASDGVIISFAEHNGSYSAAYKNIFDWCSRIDMKVYQNKPMLLLATSPGSRGGENVLKTALESTPFFGGDVVASFKLGSFATHFSDQTNEIVSHEPLSELRASVHAFGSAILINS
ncbi:MAG: NAD(P)H-dependent oxidoreductase [Pseudomonadota bacterium]